ncbi:MAG: hypothetical protein ACLTKQ_00925 [Acutalibacteraceae bacterium]
MDQTKEIDIDLKKIFLMMRKKVVYILLFTLLGGHCRRLLYRVLYRPKVHRQDLPVRVQ